MILEDFVMLGKTVPEPNGDGRVFVCSAGVSRELDTLIRIYPLARHNAPPRWSVSRVRLERNPRDSRRESWKLAGDRTPGAHEQINGIFERTGEIAERTRAELLERYAVESLRAANEARLSLAVIHPCEAPLLQFDHNPESPESPQLSLFEPEGRPMEGAKRFAFIPRLQFADRDGFHSLTLRDWGCFEFMRKHGDERRHELRVALGLDGDCSLFVGNQNHRRTGWLVISVLRQVRASQLSLLVERGQVTAP
jgi:hypothetical protein